MGAVTDLAEQLAASVADLEAEHAGTLITIQELQARVTMLTEALAARPPAVPTIVGSSAQPGTLDAFNQLEAQVGPLGAWRLFIRGGQPGPYDVDRIRTCINGERRPVTSVTAGTSIPAAVNAAKAFVSLIGPLGGAGSITYGHEPTQKFADPKAYIAAKNAYYRVIQDELPAWDCIDIFMLYDIVAGGVRHPDNWIAELDLLDGFGVDAYDQGKKSPKDMLAPALTLADAYDLPLWVCETSTIEHPENPDYKPGWIAEFCRYAASVDRIPGWLWFHSKVGPNAPEYGWFVDTSEASTEAFRRAVATCPPY